MTLDADDYRAHLDRDCRRLREVLTAVDPAARVPACADWDAADLLWHHTDVLWFWTAVLRRRPAAPDDALEAERPARPASYADLLAVHAERAAGLLAALDGLAASEPAWSWSTDRTVGFVLRRQAHEALVHRLDAEQTAGAETPLDPALAADGVAELVDVMYGGEVPPWGGVRPGEHVVALHPTDAAGALGVRPSRFVGTEPDSGSDVDEPMLVRTGVEPASATVTGTAGDLDGWMWGRLGEDRLVLDGDPEALAALRAVLDTPLT